MISTRVEGQSLQLTKLAAHLMMIRFTEALFHKSCGDSGDGVFRFWSVTMYAADNKLFFDAPYNATDGAYRYNINAVTPGFTYNGGNFTIYMSVAPPPARSMQHKNWLPIGTLPSSRFYLILRLYGPSQEAQAGHYDPPPILAHARGASAA